MFEKTLCCEPFDIYIYIYNIENNCELKQNTFVSAVSSTYDTFYLVVFSFLSQSVKIVTYKEPQNAEYKQFVSKLKADAKKMFNFSIGDSLVSMERFNLKLNYHNRNNRRVWICFVTFFNNSNKQKKLLRKLVS